MNDSRAVGGSSERTVPEPLRWVEASDRAGGGPAVVLLDQTRLPAHEVEVVCADVPSLVDAVRRLVVRGAPLLGLAGAFGVALAAASGADVEASAEALASARPTAVNLRLGAQRALHAWRFAGGDPAAALDAARLLCAQDRQASAAMAAHGLALVPQNARILTHCNTGALVSAGEGTAFAVVLSAHRAGRLRQLWVDETRPLLQGARLTAYEASRHGLPHAVLPDDAAGSLFAAGRVDLVLVGADRIAADGSTANKVGTYPLAVLARHHDVPFVVVAPTTTIDVATPSGKDIEVEHRSHTEVLSFGGAGVAPTHSPAYNPAFDVTPPSLIMAIVTEKGVLSPAECGLVARTSAGHDPVMRR